MKEDIKSVYFELLNECIRFRTFDFDSKFMKELDFEERMELDSTEFDNLKKEVLHNFSKVEYGIDSKCLYGGFYSASPTQHIVVGGSKKGKITLTQPKKNSFHKYYFNVNDELICIETFFIIYQESIPDETHFIFKNNNKEIRLVFGNMKERASTIICNYQNKHIISYALISCNWDNVYNRRFEYEKYHYNSTNGTMTESDLISCSLIENNTKIKIHGDKNILKWENNHIVGIEIKPVYFSSYIDLNDNIKS